MQPETQDRLAAIAGAVDAACVLLVSPSVDHLDDCAGILEQACADFAAIPAQQAAEYPAEARRLAESIGQASALLAHAGEFHQSWRRTRNAMCSGYRADGDAADAPMPARLCFLG